ncbi:MAG: protein kinase [Bryobacteraceae bacterium]
MLERIGKYKVESRLGQGGMGTVYLALDSQIQRRVAIKVFKLEISNADPRTAERFRAEAQTTAGLRHPHIVTVYEYGEQDGIPYIVMEYLQGTDLHRVLQQGSKLSLLEKVRIIAEVASGLQYAHEKGIIHRDIKPANIMLQPNGSAMLTDFGIARGAQLADTRLTPTQLMMGTLAYMAPELFYHSDASVYSDMFAFGLVCYELLTGTHPFRAPTEAMVIQKILNESPEPVRGMLTDCPEELSRAVERLLAKHKEHRFASLADFEMVLRPVLVELRRAHAAELAPIVEQHLESDHLDEARRALRKIADLDPGNPALAGLLRRLDDRQRTLSVGPQIASLAKEAEKLVLARRTDEALERIQQAIELDPADKTLRLRAVEIQEMRERSARAQSLLESAVRDLDGRNLTGAVRKVNQAREADPEIPGAGIVLERIQHERNRQEREEAIQDALQRSRMALLVDDFAEGCTILESALAVYPDSTELQRARVEAQKGRAENERRRRIEEAKDKVRTCLERNQETEALSVLDLLREEGIEDADLKRLRAAVASRLNAARRRAELDAGCQRARQEIHHGNYAEARRILADLGQMAHDERVDALLEEVNRRSAQQDRQTAISGVIAKAEDLRSKERLSEAVAMLDRAIGEIGADPRLTALREHLSGLEQARRQQRLQDAAREIETLLDEEKLTRAQDLLEEALPTAPLDRRLLALRMRLEEQRRAREQRKTSPAAAPTPPARPNPPAGEEGEQSTERMRFGAEAPAASSAAPVVNAPAPAPPPPRPPSPPPPAASPLPPAASSPPPAPASPVVQAPARSPEPDATRVEHKPAPPPRPKPVPAPAMAAAAPAPRASAPTAAEAVGVPAAARPRWLLPAGIGAAAGVAIMGGLLLRGPSGDAPPAAPVSKAGAAKAPVAEPVAANPPNVETPKQEQAANEEPAAKPAPAMSLDPETMRFAWREGEPPPPSKMLLATGTGGPWKASPSERWLLVSPARGAGPGAWNVGVVGSRVPVGREVRGEVTVTGSGVRSTVAVVARVEAKAAEPPAPRPVPPDPAPTKPPEAKPRPAEPRDSGRKILSASEYAGDPFGTITWMGELKDQDTVTLTSDGASNGQLLGKRIGGEWFPPIRFSVQVSPALKVEQQPSEGNRFGRMVIRNTTGAAVTTFRITWKQVR